MENSVLLFHFFFTIVTGQVLEGLSVLDGAAQVQAGTDSQEL